MINQLTAYYIPNNPNITNGPIYALYLNHNTNLDLSQIINDKRLPLNQISKTNDSLLQEESQITISKDDYNKLLELNNKTYQLTTKRTEDIKAFVQAETKTTEALSQINAKRVELIKKITKKGLLQ